MELYVNELQSMLEEQLRTIPWRIFEQHVEKKIKSAGVNVPPGLPHKIVEHFRSGSKEPFCWDDGKSDDISLSLGDSDFEEITRAVEDFLENKLSEVVDTTSEFTAKLLLKTLHSRWRGEHRMQKEEMHEFRERLEVRWGRSLDRLRIMLTIFREWAQIGLERRDAKRRKDVTRLEDILLRLHVRSCQVTAEIILLLESGFADGAMARWRTLHELAIVTLLVSQHGEALAERYFDHQAIEAMRALRAYESSCDALGFRRPTKKDVSRVKGKYTAALEKHGKDFHKDYGWATPCLNGKAPTFAALEEAAGHALLRSHYKMASYNVHAGPQGLFQRLGVLNGEPDLLAGPSNIGLVDPAQQTGFSLILISIAICQVQKALDDLVFGKVLTLLFDETLRALKSADTRLRRDEAGRREKRRK